LEVIVATLKIYDGQLTPQLPLGITLNSYLALFTSLAKLCLLVPIIQGLGQLRWLWFKNRPRPLADFELFEDASRGSFGSLRLLVSMKGGYVCIDIVARMNISLTWASGFWHSSEPY